MTHHHAFCGLETSVMFVARPLRHRIVADSLGGECCGRCESYRFPVHVNLIVTDQGNDDDGQLKNKDMHKTYLCPNGVRHVDSLTRPISMINKPNIVTGKQCSKDATKYSCAEKRYRIPANSSLDHSYERIVAIQ